MQDKLLRPEDAADLLGVSRTAMYTWMKQGRIKPVKLPNGRYRIALSEIQRVMELANPDTKIPFITPDYFKGANE
jgi:excisionase family DNA binding protein